MNRTVLITTVLLSTTRVFALDFMGPTTSRLKASGQSSAAIEYFWSNMEIEADGIPELGLVSDTIEDVKFNKVSANLALGMGRGSEIFFRFGVADADPDRRDNRDNIAGYIGGSDEDLLLGGGVKWTLYERTNFGWGLLVQTSWTDYDFDEKSYLVNGYDVTLSTDVEVFETQIATGPTVALREDVIVYGGPFLHFIRGDAELKGTIDGIPYEGSPDLEEESLLGAYIGIQIELRKNAYFSAEFQTTDDSYGAGCHLVWRF